MAKMPEKNDDEHDNNFKIKRTNKKKNPYPFGGMFESCYAE